MSPSTKREAEPSGNPRPKRNLPLVTVAFSDMSSGYQLGEVSINDPQRIPRFVTSPLTVVSSSTQIGAVPSSNPRPKRNLPLVTVAFSDMSSGYQLEEVSINDPQRIPPFVTSPLTAESSSTQIGAVPSSNSRPRHILPLITEPVRDISSSHQLGAVPSSNPRPRNILPLVTAPVKDKSSKKAGNVKREEKLKFNKLVRVKEPMTLEEHNANRSLANSLNISPAFRKCIEDGEFKFVDKWPDEDKGEPSK